jgi:formylglycine-generating enzyme required for sulfatase activity
MVLVPAGPFLQGDPPHEVILEAFRIDRTEVTRSDYDKCVAARACSKLPDAATPSDAEHPVVRVTPAEAAAYCTWMDKRLPTEAQWEKAARGVDGRRYPWGDATPTCDLALFERWTPERSDTCGEKNAYTVTHAVGAHPRGASPYGALDMAGNALEWTSDVEGPHAVARGGRVLGNEDQLQTTFRKLVLQSLGTPSRDPVIGFRCALAARRIPERPSP